MPREPLTFTQTEAAVERGSKVAAPKAPRSRGGAATVQRLIRMPEVSDQSNQSTSQKLIERLRKLAEHSRRLNEIGSRIAMERSILLDQLLTDPSKKPPAGRPPFVMRPTRKAPVKGKFTEADKPIKSDSRRSKSKPSYADSVSPATSEES
jgi:hypothetical protein